MIKNHEVESEKGPKFLIVCDAGCVHLQPALHLLLAPYCASIMYQQQESDCCCPCQDGEEVKAVIGNEPPDDEQIVGLIQQHLVDKLSFLKQHHLAHALQSFVDKACPSSPPVSLLHIGLCGAWG